MSTLNAWGRERVGDEWILLYFELDESIARVDGQQMSWPFILNSEMETTKEHQIH